MLDAQSFLGVDCVADSYVVFAKVRESQQAHDQFKRLR
jgi:hypothetical protein